jgi:hypothetical protein
MDPVFEEDPRPAMRPAAPTDPEQFAANVGNIVWLKVPLALSSQPLTRSIYLTNAATKLGKIWRSVTNALPLFVLVPANEYAAKGRASRHLARQKNGLGCIFPEAHSRSRSPTLYLVDA